MTEVVSDATSEVGGEAELPVLETESLEETNGAELLTVGARLKRAREAKAMSVADVAQSMKLSTRQVQALESDQWDVLPGVTFIRGFTRNYARLVDESPDALMQLLDDHLDQRRPELALPETVSTTMPDGGAEAQRRDYAFAVIGLLVVVVAVAVYLLFPENISRWRDQLKATVAGVAQPAPVAVSVAVPVEAEPVLPPGSSVQQVLNPQSEALAGASVEAPASDAATATASPAAIPVPPEAAAVAKEPAKPSLPAMMLVSVRQESWVEVRDRNGNVLLSQRVPSGSERPLDGQGPFTVVLGNAPGVSIQYKGKAVDLSPYTKGDVARLTLE